MTEETHLYHPPRMIAVCLKLRLVANLTDRFKTGGANTNLTVTVLFNLTVNIILISSPNKDWISSLDATCWPD